MFWQIQEFLAGVIVSYFFPENMTGAPSIYEADTQTKSSCFLSIAWDANGVTSGQPKQFQINSNQISSKYI